MAPSSDMERDGSFTAPERYPVDFQASSITASVPRQAPRRRIGHAERSPAKQRHQRSHELPSTCSDAAGSTLARGDTGPLAEPPPTRSRSPPLTSAQQFSAE